MSDDVTEEREELRKLVRRFCEEKSSSAAIRALIDAKAAGDSTVWTQMAEEIGLQAIPIPEQYGGAGYGAVELGIVLEEMGHSLLISPYFTSIALAAQTLLAFGDEQANERWLPGIADGSLTATVAIAEGAGAWDAAVVQTAAVADGDGWRLTGSKWFVPDGATADLVLVVAITDDGPALFGVEGNASGVTRTSLEGIDPTRAIARIDLDDAAAILVESDDFRTRLDRALDAICTAVAAEQVGGAQRCLEMAVEYAKIRVQFERPIGSFQAIKNKCVEMFLLVESGRVAASYASQAIASRADDAREAASVAKAACSKSFTFAAKENIQIHGGIGYTWEHDAHLYLKRAKSSELLFGTPQEHRKRLADTIGI